MNNKELGIYIHIPFCKKKCYYCDFVSFSNLENKQTGYIEALKKEISCYDLEEYNVTTIYIGGGTPSYIDCYEIKEILDELRKRLKNNETKFSDIEITIEVNPGTVDKEKLEVYKLSGVNRLSIGLQSTKDILLKEIGRIHTYKEFLQSYEHAKQVGFENINVDLMLGLPNQSIQDMKDSLKEVIKIEPNHISIYSLIVEEKTPIKKLIEEGELQLPEEIQERRMYWYVKSMLELSGYNHYEISNFAKEGRESKHNMNCWEQKEYIGLGVAAHSYINGIRYSNVTDLDCYIKNMMELKNVKKQLQSKTNIIYNICEIQNLEDKQKEYMLLGLRKIQGVSITKFKEKYVENPIFLFRKQMEKLTKEDLLQIDGDYIRLTNKGLDFANQVWEEFV